MPHPFLSADNVAGVDGADFCPRRAAIVPEVRMFRCKRAYVCGPEEEGAALVERLGQPTCYKVL
jgi:hypothetical protein